MPTYILLSTLTPEGRQTLHKNPDRLEEVNKEIAAFGCTVVGSPGWPDRAHRPRRASRSRPEISAKGIVWWRSG
jgi:hypothetical protein